jgi:transcription termination factor Rho
MAESYAPKITPGKNIMDFIELEKQPLIILRQMATELEVPRAAKLKREQLVMRIKQAEAEREGLEVRGGILEIMSEGIGFLRSNNYQPSAEDVYVSQSQIRRYSLRNGDMVIGNVRPPRETERHYGLRKVDAINGLDPEQARLRPRFESLTPIFPEHRFDLETDAYTLATRLINLVTPIGRGQRGLIVSPPKAGKTTILKQITNAISMKYPDVHLIVALIGERPEEVTDMDRSVDAEVISSTFDEPVSSHVRVAEMVMARSKRLVEMGRDVVITMDSVTRLARAYNLVVNPSGRTLSGGIDPSALYPPKRFFGAARNIEEGGSLTIIATCLVDTGSRMDDVVYEEFKGTGNMELHLSRTLQERRIFPAIDISRSSTRREELLLGPDITPRVWLMRRMYDQMIQSPPHGAGLDQGTATEAILQRFKQTKDNQEFLMTLNE